MKRKAMKIKVEKSELTEDQINILVSVSGQLDDLETYRKRYDSGNIKDLVIEEIAKEIANKYMVSHRMEIMNSIDLTEITHGIQLKLVENFSAARNP